MSTVYSRRGQTPDYSSAAPPLATISLYQMAEQLLARLKQAAYELGTVLPDRDLIYMSPVPADCAQIAVLISGWSPAPQWDVSTSCQNFRWFGQFSVVITRCTPAIPPRGSKAGPAVDSMHRAAQIASDDAEVLVALVRGLGEIGADFALETAAPEGGLQSTVMNVQVPAFGGLE